MVQAAALCRVQLAAAAWRDACAVHLYEGKHRQARGQAAGQVPIRERMQAPLQEGCQAAQPVLCCAAQCSAARQRSQAVQAGSAGKQAGVDTSGTNCRRLASAAAVRLLAAHRALHGRCTFSAARERCACATFPADGCCHEVLHSAAPHTALWASSCNRLSRGVIGAPQLGVGQAHPSNHICTSR